MPKLCEQNCYPCESYISPLEEAKLQTLFQDLGHNWTIVNQHHLEKEYLFKDFKQALTFTNKVGEIAEQQKHHPDIHLSWGKVRIVLWTHNINGLSKNDFILASKIDIL